jgi:chemotaxis protein methyltransferase CheR
MKKDLKEICNIDVSIYDSVFFDKTLQARVVANSIISEKNYFDYLSENNDEVEILKKALNNNFSEFFRNRLTFAYLEYIILPELIQKKAKLKKKEIRIWTAACASGQEAYSLAILCNELLKSQHTNMRFRIFATDISDNEIQKAKKGIYPETALNNVTMKRVKENFEVKNDAFVIIKELKKLIDFSTFDLLDINTTSPQASIVRLDLEDN